jgi:hypothetical protein
MALYQEKLWPTIWVPASYFPLVPALILISAPFNVWIGVITAVVVYGAILIAVYGRAARVTVTEQAFTYGDALVEAEFIGKVSAFSGEAARNERGVNLDARAWTKFKAFMNGVVRIEITDPNDPTPYWLVATRHPNELAAALRRSRPQSN